MGRARRDAKEPENCVKLVGRPLKINCAQFDMTLIELIVVALRPYAVWRAFRRHRITLRLHKNRSQRRKICDCNSSIKAIFNLHSSSPHSTRILFSFLNFISISSPSQHFFIKSFYRNPLDAFLLFVLFDCIYSPHFLAFLPSSGADAVRLML